MRKQTILTHEFVEFLPENLEEGRLYVCIGLATAAHKCCCGCGNEVITPLTPTDWKLTYDGETITLHPSVGNWGFACRSHYWIRNGRIKWASKWSQEQVEAGRSDDRWAKEKYFGLPELDDEIPAETVKEAKLPVVGGIWQRLRGWWRS